jgi:hypothetical protein
MEEMNTMEIIIENDGLNGISNYEPLKAWALEQVSAYKGLVVEEDGLISAKNDCAKLRKIAKNASDYRISLKKEHEAKIAKTLEQLKELTDIFNNAALSIDTQVKEFDEKRKAEKSSAIGKIYEDNIGEMGMFLPMKKIWNDKWLNKGYGLDAIEKEIKTQVESVRDGIATIRMLGTKYESEMISAFLANMQMTDALKKKSELEQIEVEMERRRKEQEIKEQEQKEEQKEVPKEEHAVEAPKVEQKFRLAFEVFGNKEQLTELVEYLKSSSLDYKRLA